MLACLVATVVSDSLRPLCDSLDYSLPGSSAHGVLQARILECPGGGNSGLMTQNCSEGEAVELMTQTAPWGNKRADDPVVPRTGEQ